jgi:hypothetical protein
MKITTVGRVVNDPADGYVATFTSRPARRGAPEVLRWPLKVFLPAETYDPSQQKPIHISATPTGSADGIWLCGERVIEVSATGGETHEQVAVRIKHALLRESREFERIQREVQAFENMQKIPDARRERIPDAVRLFVWQRDEGRCTRCGSQERLEFDHIVPIALGGSNTDRNIQLLCERCNREKGKRVG